MEKEYKTKIGPGTAGIAQRISSEYEIPEGKRKETSKLYALMHNDIMPCGQNQY